MPATGDSVGAATTVAGPVLEVQAADAASARAMAGGRSDRIDMVMSSRVLRLAVLASFVALARLQLAAQGDGVGSSYVKYKYQIPMRDGVKLYTAVYQPKDGSTRYPIMLERTPYGVAPYGVDRFPAALGPSDLFQKDGYIFVVPGRARTLHVRRRVGRDAATRSRPSGVPPTSTKAPTPTTPSSGC